MCLFLAPVGHYWKRMGRFLITDIRDLTGKGLDTETPDMKPLFPTSSSSQMITYKFSNGYVADGFIFF
jgi:hypothetical protein